MYCSKCGAKLPDNAKFCNVCGAAVTNQVDPTYVNPTYSNPVNDNAAYQRPTNDNAAYQRPTNDNAAYQGPTYDNAAYQNPTNDNAAYQNPTNDNAAYQNPTNDNAAYQNPTYDSTVYQNPTNDGATYQNTTYDNNTYQSNTYTDTLQKPKGKKKLIFIIAGIVLVVAVALVLLFVFVFKPKKNAVAAVKDALMNTATSKSLTLQVKTGRGSDASEGIAMLELKDDNLYVSTTTTDSDDPSQEYYILDEDGFYRIYERSSTSSEKKYRVRKNMDEESAKELRDALNESSKSEKNGMKKLEELLDDEFGRYADCDNLEALLNSVIDEFDKPENLKECLGCEESKEDGQTIYTFKPDLYKCARLLLEQVEERFKDKDYYEGFMDSLKENKSDINRAEFELSVGIKGGNISSFSFKPDSDSDDSMEATITDVNSTSVEIPDDVIDALKDYKSDHED